MFRRMLTWGVRSYIRGPGKSWMFTSAAMLGLRAFQSKSAKVEVVDMSKTKPGDRIVIEHLDVSHKAQIKEMKRDSKRAEKEAKRAAKLAKKA